VGEDGGRGATNNPGTSCTGRAVLPLTFRTLGYRVCPATPEDFDEFLLIWYTTKFTAVAAPVELLKGVFFALREQGEPGNLWLVIARPPTGTAGAPLFRQELQDHHQRCDVLLAAATPHHHRPPPYACLVRCAAAQA
jgi:hypothetical protein